VLTDFGFSSVSSLARMTVDKNDIVYATMKIQLATVHKTRFKSETQNNELFS